MTASPTPPPKPPEDAPPSPTPTTAGTPAAPRRIPRDQAPRPAPEDHRKVGLRSCGRCSITRWPTGHAATRGNKPDLRDLPRPRRDVPSNVWRADPPPAAPSQDMPPRDRRDGPRRAHGDAPRPDSPGERRANPGPWQDRGPRPEFRDHPDDRRPGPPPQGERRRDAMPPDERGGHPRDRDRDRPPSGDRERAPYGQRDRAPFDERDRPPYGERGRGPSYPQGPNERPRYQGPRRDEPVAADRGRPERGDRRPPGPGDRPPPRRRDDVGREAFAPRPPQAERPPRPAPDPDAPKREDQRLSKVLAERGIASRREADEWIEAGWVKVDGEVATLGARVFAHQVIEVDEAAKTQQARRVTILLHKPVGYVSGQAEDGYEPASVLVTPANHWPDDPSRERWNAGHGRHLAPAGRLDIDSTGLLVLTQDGRIARHLIGDESDVEKEYLVRVEYPSGGQFPDNDLQRLRHGLWLDGHELRPAKVSWANEDQLRFVLREGRKRQIRRMCEAVGLVVTGLKRVRIGSVVLGKLPAGQWRYLRDDERF
ncbi:MAG TPA: pseudouridine synthase [Burkholderiaceae bacterium]|nr:pseudouridine synthase [Burkholderiaceae bacterium]